MRSPAAPSPRSAAGAGRSEALAGDLHRGDLLEEDRVQDLPRDRGRDLATFTTPLRDHHHDDLRRLRRRKGGEPRVVLALLGLRLGDHLRGAGLSGDVEAGDAGRRGRHRTPPLAIAAMKRATCIGVTSTVPCPMDMLTVSPAGYVRP